LLAPGVLDFADFRPNGSLLDCGTGTGSLACAIAAPAILILIFDDFF
jgi:precorrin-6B methylase 2